MATFEESLDLGFKAYKKGLYALAVECYGQAVKSNFLDVESRVKLAASLLVEGSVRNAKTILNGVLRHSPRHPRAWVLFGCCLEFEGDIPSAATIYRDALQIQSVDTAAFTNLSHLLVVMGNASIALELLKKSMDLPPTLIPSQLVAPSLKESLLPRPTGCDSDVVSGSACALLGIKLQESGKLEEAIACFLRAIELHPLSGTAFYNLARAQRINPGDLSLLDSIDRALANPAVATSDRSLMHFALGKAHDDLGAHDQAIAHFDLGNAIFRQIPGPSFDKPQFQRLVDSVIATFNKKVFKGTARALWE